MDPKLFLMFTHGCFSGVEIVVNGSGICFVVPTQFVNDCGIVFNDFYMVSGWCRSGHLCGFENVSGGSVVIPRRIRNDLQRCRNISWVVRKWFV